MRELKFRVWDPLAQEIIGWEHWNKQNTFYFINSNGSSVFTMQYTGLEDKNGKEIYEGDIVQGKTDIFDRMTGQVTFAGTGYVIDGVGKYKRIREELYNYYEVIGNIYENPELMEASQ